MLMTSQAEDCVMNELDIPGPPAELRVITESEAASYCSLSLVHFRRLRRQQIGPKHVQLGIRRIGYRVRDLLDWLDNRVCR